MIGGKLLACAVHVARRRGFRSLVSIGSDKNLASISGCVAYGFKPAAALDEVGRLGGVLEKAPWLQKSFSWTTRRLTDDANDHEAWARSF